MRLENEKLKQENTEKRQLEEKIKVLEQRMELVLDMIENAQKNNSQIFIRRRK